MDTTYTTLSAQSQKKLKEQFKPWCWTTDLNTENKCTAVTPRTDTISPCHSKYPPPTSSPPACLLLLIVGVLTVSNSNQPNQKRIFQMTGYYERYLVPFLCIYLCRSPRKTPPILLPRVARRWKMPGVAGRRWRGRAGCCTCLLPWGFWRSDYAVMRLRERRICFRRGGSGKGGDWVCMSRSLSHQLCGGGIYFRQS